MTSKALYAILKKLTLFLPYRYVIYSDGVEYSTSEHEYRKKLRVRVLILKNVLKYKYRKNIQVQVLSRV